MVVSTRSATRASPSIAPKSPAKSGKKRSRTSNPKAKPPPKPITAPPRKTTNPAPKPSSPSSSSDKVVILPILYTFLSRLSSAESTICPSQVARRMHEIHPAQYPDWRAMMDPVRNIVWEEVAEGRVEVTQGGVVRTLEEREGLKGPIRVRRGKTPT